MSRSGITGVQGETVFLLGRIPGLTRRRLDHLIMGHGGKLARAATGRVTLAVVGSTATPFLSSDGRILLPSGLPDDVPLVSEASFRRALGLMVLQAAAERSFSSAALQRLAKVTPAVLAALQLFDVVDPVEGQFSYADVVAAREVGRLLGHGIPLTRIIEASTALRRRGSHIGEARLTEGPGGELLRDVGGRTANLDGQLSMGLEEGIWSVDDLLCAAEEAEEQGSLAQAESLYTTAMRADTTDPVIPFNLGNIYEAQGRSTEAKVAWQIAVARDPGFAEGWYNLALTAEDESQTELAIAAYKRSIEARPDFTDGLYNLAFLLTELERCHEALPLWERLLKLGLVPEQAKIARNAAALCRMMLQRDRIKSA